MTPPSILLVTRYFPPLDSIASLRMYCWAKYIDRNGWRVSVLTTTKEHQMLTPWKLHTGKFDLTEVRYFDPVLFFGFKKKNRILSGKRNRLEDFYRSRLSERMPGRTDPWIVPAIRELKRRKQNGVSYDYVLSSYGPPSAHVVGCYAKTIFGSKWIADYRDLWLENYICKGLFPFILLESILEKQIMKHVDLIATVSEPLRDVLMRKFPAVPVHVIENGFDPELMDGCTGDYFRNQSKKLRICYTGSLYRKKIDPGILFRAIRELISEGRIQESEIEVLFFGSYMADLDDMIKSYSLQSVARYVGNVSLFDAYRIQRSASALLFLGESSPHAKGIVTGKLFEYLHCDAPILAVGISPDSAAAKIIEETGSGIVCGTEIRVIQNEILNIKKGDVNCERDQEKIRKYSREHQVDRLIQIMLES